MADYSENYRDAIREAYASAPSDVVDLHTLEIYHPAFVETIYVVRNHQDMASWIRVGGSEVQTFLDGLTTDAQDRIGLVARIEDGAARNGGELVGFFAVAFELDLPEGSSSPSPELVLTIDNASLEISDALFRAANSPHSVEIIYRPYLSTDISGPQMIPPLSFQLTHAPAQNGVISARATMLNLGNLTFPNKRYTYKFSPRLS